MEICMQKVYKFVIVMVVRFFKECQLDVIMYIN